MASAKDGLQHYCKGCATSIASEWRKKNEQKHAQNRKNAATRNQDKLWQVLSDAECVDCKIKDPYVLQFDHKDQLTKTCNIAVMTWNFSWERIQEEIDKCEVRCANCHQKKSAFQLGLWRSRY
jgi:hypothetical protein